MASKKTLEHYLRQLRLIEEHREKWAEQNIRRHYRDLMTDLQEFLGVEYAKLAQDDKLTYEILHSKGQYARFIEEVERRINKFTPKASQEIRDTVQLTYKKCFEGMVDAVEKSETYEELKLNLKGVRAVTPDVVKNAVSNEYMEKALEKNHKAVIYDIKQQIGIGLSQGDRMSTMARRISEQLDKDYRRAVMIARTECHRVREAGFQDSSARISEKLKETDSDYVMTKTWMTMNDGAVRPYRVKGKKGHKTVVKSKGPDHTKMHGVIALVEDKFDLGDGVTAISPGQSGVAGHDINCRCYTSKDLMLKSEYEKVSGKKVEVADPSKPYEAKEKTMLEDKETIISNKDAFLLEKANLEAKQYADIWKDPVTVKDYADKKGAISAKRDYFKDRLAKYEEDKAQGKFDEDILDAFIKKNQDLLKLLDEFEKNGEAYLKLIDDIADADKTIALIDDQIKAVRQKIMKLKGIDVDEMQKEIDSLIDEINKLKKPKPKQLSADEVLEQITLEEKYHTGNFGDITGKQYLTNPDIKNNVDDALEHYKAKYLDKLSNDPDYDGVFAKKYKELQNFVDEVNNAQKLSDVDDSILKEAISGLFDPGEYEDLFDVKNYTVQDYLNNKDGLAKKLDDAYEYNKENLNIMLAGDPNYKGMWKQDVDILDDFFKKVEQAKKLDTTKLSKADDLILKESLNDMYETATSNVDLYNFTVEDYLKNKNGKAKDFDDAYAYAKQKHTSDPSSGWWKGEFEVLDHFHTLVEQAKQMQLSNPATQSALQTVFKDLPKSVQKDFFEKFFPDAVADLDEFVEDLGHKTLEELESFVGISKKAEMGEFVSKALVNAIDDDTFEEIAKLEKQLAKKQDELVKIRKRYGLEDDKFSQARKDAAYWFTTDNGGAEAADNVLRDKCGEIWKQATQAQKESAYEYTRSFHKYNEPLRGIEYGTSKFVGVGNVDMENIGVSYSGFAKGEVKKLIDDLTDIIDESTYDHDMWFQRGTSLSGMDKFFNIDPSDFNLSEKELADKLLGTTPTEYGFMSTGVAKGKGMNLSGSGVTMNIYAPKGTKMLYCEPFSAFGNGQGKKWDGIKTQSSISSEAEMLFQRGTKFRVTKVEKSGSRWYIDMEVISQER
ncbi:MAG: hypothetical protein IKY67_06335 [Paludibacteraceae bacterium]|nr:hypothetical protein [Paludibacteraceae bacterium]